MRTAMPNSVKYLYAISILKIIAFAFSVAIMYYFASSTTHLDLNEPSFRTGFLSSAGFDPYTFDEHDAAHFAGSSSFHAIAPVLLLIFLILRSKWMIRVVAVFAALLLFSSLASYNPSIIRLVIDFLLIVYSFSKSTASYLDGKENIDPTEAVEPIAIDNSKPNPNKWTE